MFQRKRLTIAIAVACISIALATPAYAEDNALSVASELDVYDNVIISIEDKTSSVYPYPTDIQFIERGERNYIHKTFTVSADFDPNMLIESPFTQGDFYYKYSEIIHREHVPMSQAKAVSETKTIESDSEKQADILARMGNVLPYADDDGFVGEMIINPESLIISEYGRTNYSYTITDVQEYPNLDRNDPSYIPQTVSKSGVTLALQNIEWRITGKENMGYSETPSKYTAVATYSAPATGSKVSGYTATATFVGEAKKELSGKNTYTIVYEGAQVLIPFNYIPFIIAGLIIAGCAVAIFILWHFQKNAELYVYQQGIPALYSKERIKRKSPILKLTQLDNVQIRLVMSKKIAAALSNQMLFVVGRYHNLRFPLDGNEIQEFWIAGRDEKPESIKKGEENK